MPLLIPALNLFIRKDGEPDEEADCKEAEIPLAGGVEALLLAGIKISKVVTGKKSRRTG